MQILWKSGPNTISLAIGCTLGLFIFLMANPVYTSSYSGPKLKT
jgi:hypothetical protein